MRVRDRFNIAKQIPGKEEFYETLRYFQKQIDLTGVQLYLNHPVDKDFLLAGQYDEIVLATGVSPRQLTFEGIDHPKVLSYVDVLKAKREVGHSVAIIGAGGIGFDVSEYLLHASSEASVSLNIPAFMEEWGVDMSQQQRGGLQKPVLEAPHRKIYLLQRSEGKLGARLGKTTGWIHRASLRKRQVEMISEEKYQKVDDRGLHLLVKGAPRMLVVDTVVACAGQLQERSELAPLEAKGAAVHLIGGAEDAAELDAKRAIEQGTRLAATF